MTRVAFGAAADGFVVLDAAVGTDTTSSIARIGTFQVEAGLVTSALLVLGTFWVATSERITQEIGRARTDGTVILDSTFGVSAARSARISATEVETGLVVAAFKIAFAFVFARVDGVAEIAVQTRANGAGVLHSAFGVLTARTRRAKVQTETSGTTTNIAAGGADARDEGIAGESAWAGTHSHVIAYRTIGIDSARRGTRADASVVQANLIRSAIKVF